MTTQSERELLERAAESEAGVMADMKARADAYGLWAEVKDAYDGYRKSGDTPAVAAGCALYDWDL